MFYSARSRLFFRITSVVTLLFFFPVSVEAANLLPPAVEEAQQPVDSSSALQLLDETRLAQLDAGASFSPLPEMKLASLHTEAKAGVEDAASPEKLARRSEKSREVSTEQAVSTTDDAPEVLTDSALKTTPVAGKADDALAASSEMVSDMRIAKVLTIRKNATSSRTSENATRIIKSAPVHDQAEMTSVGAKTTAVAPREIDLSKRVEVAKSAFVSGEYAQAVSSLIDIVDVAQKSSKARHSADKQLQGLWREMRLGVFSEKQLDSIEASIPAIDAVATAEGAHAAMKFFAMRGEVLEDSKAFTKAKAHFEEAQVRAADVMKRFPTSPILFDTMNEYLSASSRLGHEGYVAALQWAYSLYRDRKAPFALACAAQGISSYKIYRHMNARVQAWVMHGDMVIDAETEQYKNWVNDPELFDWVRAELLYTQAMAYYELGNWGDAHKYFAQIVKQFPDAGEVTERAALAWAFVGNRINYSDFKVCIQSYQDFINTYPQSRYVARALWAMADVYWRAENVQTALDTYQKVIQLFPDSHFVKSAQRNCDFIEQYISGTEMGAAVPVDKEVLEVPVLAKLCGPEALHHYLALHGQSVAVQELSEAAQADAKGVSMQALLDTAKTYGYDLVGVEMDALPNTQEPFLAHVKDHHFVLVLESSNDSVRFIDSFARVKEEVRGTFTERFAGVALLPAIQAAPFKLAQRELLETAFGGATPIWPSSTPGTCPNGDPPAPPPTCDVGDGDGAGGYGPPGVPDNLIVAKPNYAPGKVQGAIGAFATAVTAPEMDLQIMGRQGSQHARQTDISVPVRGELNLMFRRTFFNPWGCPDPRYNALYSSFGGEIGKSWTHNFSDYALTSENSDANGAPYGIATVIRGATRYYLNHSTTSGVTKYIIDGVMEGEWNTGGALTHELGNVLFRNADGTFYVQYPSGLKRYFTAPTNYISRLDRIQDKNGNAITVNYSAGKITTVTGPDTRYLNFEYNASNRITKVSLKKTGVTTAIKEFSYQYNSMGHLTKVIYPDATYETFTYQDGNGTYNGQSYPYLYMSNYYDRSGARTSFTAAYESDTWQTSWVHAFDLTVTHHESGLTTCYQNDDTQSTGRVLVSNYDGPPATGTLLTRARYDGDASAYHNAANVYYGDASGTSTRSFQFSHSHANYRDYQYTLEPGPLLSNRYFYNAQGQVTEIHRRYGDDSSSSLRFQYDAAGLKVTKRIDPNGCESTYQYDTAGNLTRYYHPRMGTGDEQYAYDTYGQLTSRTDPVGNAWTYTYDSYGDLSTVTTPLNNITTYQYDDLGRTTSITDPLNKTTSYAYEDSSCSCGGAVGQISEVTDPDNNVTEMQYDTYGRLTKTIDALNRTTGYAYDNMHRLTAVKTPHDATTNTTTYQYDAMSRRTSVTDSCGNETTYHYDFYGDLTRENSPEVGDTTYVYWGNSNLKQITDPRGKTTNFYYWNRGGLAKRVDAEGNARHYEYDKMGNLTKIAATAAGATEISDPVQYYYSSTTGQLSQVKYTNENSTAVFDVYYHYDNAGRLTQVDDSGWMAPTGTTEDEGHYWYYDADSRITKYTDYDHTSAHPKELNLTYDDAGRVITMNDYDGYATTYTYTNAGRVSTVTTPGNKTWTYNYNVLGQPTTIALPNGMTTAYAYDTLNRMTKLEHKDGTTVKEGWEYALDANGNILRMASTVANDDSAWEYAYDGRGRLLDAMQRNAAGLPKQRYSYTYDAGDNLLTKQCSPFKASPSLQDDFSDGDYTASPAWTVKNGTWSVDPTGLYLRADHTIANEIYTAQTQSEYELWFSYYFEEAAILAVPLLADANGLGGPALRIVDSGMEFNTGTPSISRTINTELGQWYDVRVRVEGDTITVWRGNQGEGLNLVLQQSGFTIPAPAQLGFMVLGDKVRIDNLRLITANNTDYNFTDDFNDGDMSGWNVGSNLSASSGAVRTLANISGYSSFSRYRPLSDGDIKFSYTLESTSTVTYPRIEVLARYYNWNNQILVRLYKQAATIHQYKDGVYTELATSYDAPSTLDQTYDITLHYDGNRIEVWRGEAGQPQSLILSTDAATHLSGGNLYFRVAANTMAEIDDITFSVPHAETTVYTCNNANELTSMTVGSQPVVTYTYDAWGRTQTEQQTLDSTTYTRTYSWWFGDKLKKRVSTFPGEDQQVDYLYDGLGKRRNQVVNWQLPGQAITWYRWIGSNESAQYAEGTDASTTWDIGARTHSWYNGAEVQGANPSTGAYTYQLKDRLGTPRGHYNQTKTRIARTSYTPYGMPDVQLGDTSSPIGYTGHLYDSQVQLNYAPYRYYNPQTARWMKSDPAGYVDGPNLYAYVGGDPLSYIDTLGLAACSPGNRQECINRCKGKNKTMLKCSSIYKVVLFFLVEISTCVCSKCEKPKKKPGKCPPCPPAPKPVIHEGPPHRPHHPYGLPHMHYFKYHQAPFPSCKCYLKKYTTSYPVRA